MSLMVEDGYDAVTVQDLIDRADVGRSTFYAHYTDKADLLDDMLGQLRGLLEPAGAESGGSRRTLRFSLEMFRHVRDQQPLMRAMLARPGAGPVVNRVELMLTDIVERELNPLAGASSPTRVPLDLVAASVVSAFLAALTWWVGDDFQQTPEEMDQMFQVLVAPGVRAAVGQR